MAEKSPTIEGFPFSLDGGGPRSPGLAQKNPFATPPAAGTPSMRTPGIRTPGGGLRASAFHLPATKGRAYFRSRRIQDITTIQKPWLDIPDKKKKWHTIFPLIGIAVGIAVMALAAYQGTTTVTNYKYCPVYTVDFSAGGELDPKIWTKELNVGGFGNGDFAQSTDSEDNVFIKDGFLQIQPTLQDEKLINENTVIDLTKQGCIGTVWKDCHAVTNTTNGTIVPPTRSARLITKGGVSIQYGRIEVEARLPEGDWLWPAIWMMPEEDTYGEWPNSGEIDIMESRGNNYTYKMGGNNVASSALHWGPTQALDAWYKTHDQRDALHTTYTKRTWTFGLEWSEKYLFTYIDGRPKQVLYTPFNKPFWQKGSFKPQQDDNGTMIVDPWSQTGNPATPFDKPFYLILNVAVGGTNGWFQDGLQSKPWVDLSPSAKLDFWKARDTWYPTWKENSALKIKSVKMWQQTGFQGCAA